MRIISPFKDFYDHAVHPSQVDESIRYIRKTHVVPYDYPSKPLISGGGSFKLEYKDNYFYKHTEEFHLGIAMVTIGSQAFPVWMPRSFRYLSEFPAQVNGSPLIPYGASARAVYIRSLMRHYESLGKRDVNFLENQRVLYAHDRKEQAHRAETIHSIRAFDATKLCLHFQTPVVMVVPQGTLLGCEENEKQAVALLNPPLRAFNLMQQIDVYQTWQNISMWIGGVMPGSCSPMVEISNKSKIEKAGFDLKYSFRTRPATTEG